MATVLVTGADRGIGAALVRAYHERGDHAIACCLGDGADLLAAGLHVEPHVDVTSLGTLKGLRRRLANTRIDVLVSNAGAYVADGDQEFAVGVIYFWFGFRAGARRIRGASTPGTVASGTSTDPATRRRPATCRRTGSTTAPA